MSEVTNLSRYRQQRRTLYLKSHSHHLEKFFASFVARYFKETYDIISSQYMSCKVSQNEMAWDYHDFRDSLKEAIADVYGDLIWSEISKLYWFDPRLISRDEVMDRCTTYFILAETAVANQ